MKREKFAERHSVAGRTPSVLITLGVAAVVLAALLVAGGFLAAQYGFFGGGTNAPSVPEDTMTRGLVGYWNMDEWTGSAARDGSGDGNDGTIYGAQWTKGKNGGALQFDGKDDYVDCGNDASLNITDAITIEAWVNSAYLNSSTRQQFISKDAAYIMETGTGGANTFAFAWYGTSWHFSTLNGISFPSGWNHLSVAFSIASGGNFYLNGNPIGSISSGSETWNAGGIFWIGAYPYLSGSNFFNGTIDEVRIYNRALSAEEVRYHYNHGGPVAHWNFDEGSGTTIHDSSGNGHNGTMHE